MYEKSSVEICKELKDNESFNWVEGNALDRIIWELIDGDTGKSPIISLLDDFFEGWWCMSGVVSHLVYQKDIDQFLSDHSDDINDRLMELMESTWCQPHELFRDRDKSDPLLVWGRNISLIVQACFGDAVYRIYEMIEDKKE